MNEDVEAFLEHFGKKGQKWGVRTASPSSSGQDNTLKGKTKKAKSGQNSLSTKIEKSKDKNLKNAIAEQKGKTLKNKTENAKYTKPGKLSNKQLKESVDRMRLEKDYATLVADKKSQSTGRRLLGKTLKVTEDVAFDVLDKQGKRVANELIGAELNKALGIKSNTQKAAIAKVQAQAQAANPTSTTPSSPMPKTQTTWSPGRKTKKRKIGP